MKKNLYLIFLLLISDFLSAQNDFRNGHIILSENDTIYGLINNLGYYANSKSCEFKKSESGPTVKYTPGEILGYRFSDGKNYISKIVEINKRQESLFLEYLINGRLNIYFCQDREGENHYFVSKDSSPLREIKYSKGIKYVDGSPKYYESKGYVGLLNYLTSDCPSVKEDIPLLNEPNHNNLISFAKKYHKKVCKDSICIIYEKKVPRKIYLNIVGGVNRYNNVFQDAYGYTNKNTVTPSFGINFFFQQAQKRERSFTGLGFYFEGKATDSLRTIILYRIPLSINYIHPKKGISPFFSYEFDINTFFVTQALRFGMKNRISNTMSSLLFAEFRTLIFINPYAASVKFGFMWDLNK